MDVNESDIWGQLVFGNTLHISSIKLVLTITQSGQQQNATVVAVTASLSLGTTVLNFSTDDTPAMLGLNPKTGVTHQDVRSSANTACLHLGYPIPHRFHYRPYSILLHLPGSRTPARP